MFWMTCKGAGLQSTRPAAPLRLRFATRRFLQEKKELDCAGGGPKIDQVTELFKNGLLSEGERKDAVLKTWEKTTNDVTEALAEGPRSHTTLSIMMADSGARGSMSQIRQLAGMRGLIANTSGTVIEIPIRANYREGLNILEYFISSRGARKGLADTALRTADSGYLTRRLVDVSQDVIIREDDCGADGRSGESSISARARKPIEILARASDWPLSGGGLSWTKPPEKCWCPRIR